MDSKSVKLPLVVIVGPTASGKTSLAIDVAKKFGGEIICADSRSIYKGADIGTAKPTKREQAGISHWGLDLVEPGEYFTVSDFKKYTDKKIFEIRSRKKLPILVGGTGLYIDSIVFDYKFGPKVNSKLRQELQQHSIDELQKYCEMNNFPLPENYKNKRYLMRTIERCGEVPKSLEKPIENCIIVGITTEKHKLRSRIEQRAEQMLVDGVADEAKILGDKYGWEAEAMRSNIYPLVRQYLDNEISLGDVVAKSITLDWRLAKRQLTWLRRNRFIHWFTLNDAEKYLNHELAIRK
ncbi:MAG: tRNA (adenosine(37)-N6)-dimethylallyltransferase MiaA [Candidatus Saccharibacteria bacterium]|nr:tRNA (adenosine(37)-N6)-dimethylallyltransferase MiaA [Candidatus Saccharibacteria bacterium]